ncbi:MAG: PadR family transcriptional regulator [Candidatus Pacebacteria bacterium]|jgi:PadR family transcriptional regulator PadR|nr:PadR family transcriptional regulator [Candidatus Paceibacterota bacterium]NMB47479.1 PadR family transcriptional regulator [Patescibacteria group bacterium]MDD2796573.1 PadR family transcriptional regulator [Candidatus Paceibacterota bacterium]MDD3048109.1 PadR family transcriptional regulator [Candidatus Paceibacterota bacterium]MDD3509751.1 PadR family transcriptional regulator [Candidatus Paceibacterota bacterium]
MTPFERLKKYNTKGNLWIYILVLLKEEACHGWDFPSAVEKRFGFRPGKITPYRVLYTLELEGFVTSKQKERRRMYKITKKGIKELEKVKDFYNNIISIL